MKPIKRPNFQKLLNKLQNKNKNKGLINYAFYFSPEEIGLKVEPTTASIEKLGLERAVQRLDRKTFFTTCMVKLSLESDGKFPNETAVAIAREKARSSLYNRITTGDTNEAIKSGFRTVEL